MEIINLKDRLYEAIYNQMVKLYGDNEEEIQRRILDFIEITESGLWGGPEYG